MAADEKVTMCSTRRSRSNIGSSRPSALANISLAKKILKWEPKVSLEQGLQENMIEIHPSVFFTFSPFLNQAATSSPRKLFFSNLHMFICMNFILVNMIYGKIGQRGQVVIPKKIRDKKKFRPGDTVKFFFKNDDLVIEKMESTADLSVAAILRRINFEDGLVEKLRSEWE